MAANDTRVAASASAASTLMSAERAYAARELRSAARRARARRRRWLADVDGRRYLDLMSAYSAVSFGHGHPRIVARAGRAGAAARASRRARIHNDELPLLLERLAQLTGLDRALPANGGAEAVETALKAARKWGHKIKGIPTDRAEIIGCHGNFHGRTITIVGFSTEPQYRDGFGPFPPGFVDDSVRRRRRARAARSRRDTAAFLVEPIQGEGGIVVPPAGYLARLRARSAASTTCC